MVSVIKNLQTYIYKEYWILAQAAMEPQRDCSAKLEDMTLVQALRVGCAASNLQRAITWAPGASQSRGPSLSQQEEKQGGRQGCARSGRGGWGREERKKEERERRGGERGRRRGRGRGSVSALTRKAHNKWNGQEYPNPKPTTRTLQSSSPQRRARAPARRGAEVQA